MLERIHYTMHAQNELVSMLELSGTRYKHIMNAYQRQLDMLKQQIKQKTNENKSDYNCLMAYLFSVQAYLYEPAIHSIAVSTTESVPFLEDPNNFNFFIHVISQASESCMLSMKHFLELDLDIIATSPLFHSSRILYNTGLLLRLRYLTLTVPHLECAIYVTDDAMCVVRDLTARIHEGTQKYPKNHFLGKMRLVLNLFTHTCLSQWRMTYKSMNEELAQQQKQQSQESSASGEPPSKKPKLSAFQQEALSAMSNMAVPQPELSGSPSRSPSQAKQNKPRQPSIFTSGPSSLFTSHLATTNTTATFGPPSFPQRYPNGTSMMNSSSSSSPTHNIQPQLQSQSQYQPQSTSSFKPNVFSTMMNQRISNFAMPNYHQPQMPVSQSRLGADPGSGNGNATPTSVGNGSGPGTTSIENLINATSSSVTGGSDIGAGASGLRTGQLGVNNAMNGNIDGINTHANGTGVRIPMGGPSSVPVNNPGPGLIPGFGNIGTGNGGAASGIGIGNGGVDNFPFHFALNDEFWSDLFIGNDKTIIDYDMSVFMNDPAAEIL
ncbi:unnamed protein product [Ambrosiozyma monospora]|uniref:Unnamed protein product n=1 Tax=Ambrosiozyma monospora TaxID=43982 RepID=A0A9W7DLS6_AMBMO|nr:unnamed protein product [Ambrosiozyma monospora]